MNPAPPPPPQASCANQHISKTIPLTNDMARVLFGDELENMEYLHTQSKGAAFILHKNEDMLELMGNPDQIAKAEQLVHQILGQHRIAGSEETDDDDDQFLALVNLFNSDDYLVGNESEGNINMQDNSIARLQEIVSEQYGLNKEDVIIQDRIENCIMNGDNGFEQFMPPPSDINLVSPSLMQQQYLGHDYGYHLIEEQRQRQQQGHVDGFSLQQQQPCHVDGFSLQQQQQQLGHVDGFSQQQQQQQQQGHVVGFSMQQQLGFGYGFNMKKQHHSNGNGFNMQPQQPNLGNGFNMQPQEPNLGNGINLQQQQFDLSIKHQQQMSATLPGDEEVKINPDHMTIMVKLVSSRKIKLDIDKNTETVWSLKEKISNIELTLTPRLRLFFADKELEDDSSSLREYSISNSSEIEVALKDSIEDPSERVLRILVKTLPGLRRQGLPDIWLQTNDTATVSQVIKYLVTNNILPKDDCLLIHNESVMMNGCSFHWHEVKDGDCVYVVKGGFGGLVHTT